jgi:cell division control protein 6
MLIEERIFTDDHIPRELHHRDGEVDALSTALQPAIHTSQANNVLIAGPSGVGKTVLARHTLDHLGKHATISYTHLDCLGKHTSQLLREALHMYPKDTRQITKTTPRDELLETARSHISRPYILVLDEADDLPTTDALDVLPSLPHVSVVAICHDEQEFLANTDSSARREIDERIQPHRYSTSELVDILEPRARRGLAPGAVDDDQLHDIADAAAGVARVGIQTLRAAAELASKRGHESIEEQDVEDAPERARSRIRANNLESLTTHHHVIYELVRDATDHTLTGRDLHARYDRLADQLYYGRTLDPITRRSRRTKLSKLVDYDLLDRDGPNSHPEYSVVEPSLESDLDIEALEA